MGQADAPRPLAVILAGPTASGKSALAAELARRLNGVVINADSMQVYRELRILTARPTPAEEATVPHALYGVRPAAEPSSAAWWRTAALGAMDAARAAGRLPILCGGTGLYLQALTQGLADIPDPGPAARTEARALLAALGPAALHARLTEADPATARTLRPSDGQRLARAWEVWRGTGQGLAAWHAKAKPPPAWSFRMMLLDPPRDTLRDAIEKRFTAMLTAGAVGEAAALLALRLDPALPALRAVGMPELASHLRGELTLEEAGRRAVLASGQYAKRQTTWFRRRAITAPCATHTIHARFADRTQFSESVWCGLMRFIMLEDRRGASDGAPPGPSPSPSGVTT